MARFDSTLEDHKVISKIADRARRDGLKITTKMFLCMDLDAANSSTGLDLGKLLAFSAFDFAHDIYGIMTNMNRETGELENCFLPRCAK